MIIRLLSTRRFFFCLPLLLPIFMSCSTLNKSEYYGALNTFPASQEKTALSYIEENKSRIYDDDDRLLYFTDLGMTYMRYKKTDASLRYLREADSLVEAAYKKGLPGVVMSYTISERSTEYIGTPMEQVQISLYRALQFAEKGDWQTAAAMARRVNDLIKENVQKLTAEHGEAIDVTQINDSARSEKDIKWHYVRDALADYVGSVAYENFKDHENALVAARNSVKTYQSLPWTKAYNIKTVPIPVRDHYCHLAKEIDKGEIRALDQKLYKSICKDVKALAANKGRVVVFQMHGQPSYPQSLTVDINIGARRMNTIVGVLIGAGIAFGSKDEDGKSSSKFQKALLGLFIADPFIRLQLMAQIADIERKGEKGELSAVINTLMAFDTNAIRVSVPVTIHKRGSHTTPSAVTIGGRNAKSELVHNLDLVRWRESFDTMPMAMLRSFSRGIFRMILAKQLEQRTSPLIGMLASAGTKSFESADTRSLRLFPAQIYLKYADVEPGAVEVKDAKGVHHEQVKAKAGKTTFVVFH